MRAMPMHSVETIHTKYPPLIQTIETECVIVLQAALTLN